MFISDFAIRRPIVTIVAMLTLVLFGTVALFLLDTDEFPDITQPTVFVGVAYPGASPDQVEREVVERLENRFAGLAGLEELHSTSTDGFAQLVVQFQFSKSVDQATQDVRDAISAERANLPAEIVEPVIQRFDPSQLPIVSLALTSTTRSPAELTTIADRTIAGDLRAIAGVAQANILGADSTFLNVVLDPRRLAAAGVSADAVVARLRMQNLAAPVGQVTTDRDEQTIRLQGRVARAEDFLTLAIATRDGTAIPLGAVAGVHVGSAERRTAALFDGREAIGIDLVKSKGYSTTAVSDQVRARVDALRPTLPAGVQLEIVRDTGERVSDTVSDVERTLVEGAALTVLVVFLFLNSWRSTVITGLALPVSVLAAFVPLLLFGFTLNTLSMLGLSLAIGLLIDDAIVVRENIVRHVHLGKDHVTAAHDGTSEIGLAVTATTCSIVAVFVPIAFMGGLAGQYFKPFALTIACAVLVSLFVSFSLDPMLSAHWPDPPADPARPRHALARAIDRFDRWFDRLAVRYGHGIGWALDHPRTMLGVAGVSMVAAVLLQVRYGGAGFAPESDRSELTIGVEAPAGASLAYTREAAEMVARQVRAHADEVRYTYTTVGSTSGSGEVDVATVYARLKPKRERRRSQQALSAVLRREFARFTGVDAYLLDATGPDGGQRQLQLRIQGPESGTLARLAGQVAAIVRGTPGAVDVGLSSKAQRPELQVDVDRGLAGTLGLDVGEIAQALRPAFAGIDAGTWVDPGGTSRYVRVRSAPEARVGSADLERLPLVVPPGGGPAGGTGGAGPTTVPLAQVARVTTAAGPAQIEHLGRQRVVTVGANVQDRSLNEVLTDVQRRVRAEVRLPAGYTIAEGGEAKQQGEVFTSVALALGTAVVLMYLILVVQFGSFLDPLAIMMALPLSLIGVVLALLLTHDTLNIMSLIGVILLMGIVAKNAILLIDFAKWGRARGTPLREALIDAGRTRLRPILMTTLALIAGMVPVALGLGEGADFRAPLGRAVIGGTVTSTILTLFVIPTIYEMLDRWRAATFAWVARRRGATPPATGTAPALPVAGATHGD